MGPSTKRGKATMASLPYITATGNIEKALNGIKSAATPESVSQDFVKTILGIKGGSGNQITSYLKKIGFASSDGKPTAIYTQFRNPSTAGTAAAAALREGYGPLYARNEYMHQLSDIDLKGLIVEETGAAEDSAVPNLILSCIKALKKFAKFNSVTPGTLVETDEQMAPSKNAPVEIQNGIPPSGQLGMNLSYTINLNLPATSDIAVFNAIFKSLRSNLLGSENE